MALAARGTSPAPAPRAVADSMKMGMAAGPKSPARTTAAGFEKPRRRTDPNRAGPGGASVRGSAFDPFGPQTAQPSCGTPLSSCLDKFSLRVRRSGTCGRVAAEWRRAFGKNGDRPAPVTAVLVIGRGSDSRLSDKSPFPVRRRRTHVAARHPALRRDAGRVALVHPCGGAGRQRLLPLSDESPSLLWRGRVGVAARHPTLGREAGQLAPVPASDGAAGWRRPPPLSDKMAFRRCGAKWEVAWGAENI